MKVKTEFANGQWYAVVSGRDVARLIGVRRGAVADTGSTPEEAIQGAARMVAAVRSSRLSARRPVLGWEGRYWKGASHSVLRKAGNKEG